MKVFLVVLFWSTWGCITYTYILFPILLHLSSLVGKSKRNDIIAEYTDDQLPSVAMVVSAFDEGNVIAQKLANTWNIDYPADRFSLIVGSDGSSDATNDILRGCAEPRLRSFLFGERRGKISVLNNIVAQTTADIIVMSDANTMYEPDAVRKLVQHFRNPEVGCVSGKLEIEQDGGVSGEGLYWKYENWIKETESKLGFVMGCNGGIFALRHSLYSTLPASTIIEDFVLTLRVIELGYRVQNESGAVATEPPCSTSRAEMTRKIRIGAGGWQALTLVAGLLHPKHGLRSYAFWGHKVFRWVVPMFMIVNLIANICLCTIPLYASLLGLQIAGLIIALAALSHRWERRMPRILRPISYYYLMNFALLCGFIRFVSKTQRVTWDRGPVVSNSEKTPTALADRRDSSVPAK